MELELNNLKDYEKHLLGRKLTEFDSWHGEHTIQQIISIEETENTIILHTKEIYGKHNIYKKDFTKESIKELIKNKTYQKHIDNTECTVKYTYHLVETPTEELENKIKDIDEKITKLKKEKKDLQEQIEIIKNNKN